MIRTLLLIGSGSFIGGVFRYLISLFIQDRAPSFFPYGTLSVNIAGCFLIGIIYGLSNRGNLDPGWRMFLATGICGGFTTFSAFSNETVSLLRDSQFLSASLYIALSVLLGITGTLIGIAMVKIL
jgi:CrcB protein